MEKSLWAKYQEEIGANEVIEYDWGFAAYNMAENAIYLTEIYVLPERRKEGLANRLADEVEEIGRRAGKTVMLGSVVLSINTAALSMKAQLAANFIPFAFSDGKLWFKREIALGDKNEQNLE